jgi:hypothetical protein
MAKRSGRRLRLSTWPVVAVLCVSAAILGPARVVTASASAWGGWEIVNDNSNKCLDSNGSATGARMQQETCSASKSQIWVPQYTGNQSWYTIKNLAYNECIAVPGSSTGNGVRLEIAACNDTAAQWWNWDDWSGANVNSEIRNWNSEKCMDVYNWSQANGAVVDQWTCGSNPLDPQQNQLWWADPGPAQP